MKADLRVAAAGVGLAAALAAPPLRPLLEASMVGHMLVHIPLLVLSGALLANAIKARCQAVYNRCDPYGLIGLLAGILTLIFWMLPRNLDLAVQDPAFGTLKIATLIALAGVPWGLAARRLPVIATGAVWVKGTAMLFVMGWLYREAPARLCNNYLQQEQLLLGNILMVLGGLSVVLILATLLVGPTGFAAPRRISSTWDQSNRL